MKQLNTVKWSKLNLARSLLLVQNIRGASMHFFFLPANIFAKGKSCSPDLLNPFNWQVQPCLEDSRIISKPARAFAGPGREGNACIYPSVHTISLNLPRHISNNCGKQLSTLWQGSVPKNVGTAEFWEWIFTSSQVNTAGKKITLSVTACLPTLGSFSSVYMFALDS